MNNYTEQQIEEKLRQLAQFEPNNDTILRANAAIRSMLQTSRQSYPLIYSIISTAAILVFCFCLFQNQPSENKKWFNTSSDAPALTLIQLHRAYESGGDKGLETYIEKGGLKRDAHPENITLNDLMKEL